MNKTFKKNYGQHFLYDKKIANSIVASSRLDPKMPILEIGPGDGILTQAIINIIAPTRLILVEKDTDLTDSLINLAKGQNEVELIFEDFLKFDLNTINSHKLQIISNLPYNISKKIIIKLWYEIDKITSLTLMFQKEFAQKLQPKNSKNNPLSLVAQAYYNIETLKELKAGSFYPKPKVSSVVLQFSPRPNKITIEKTFFWTCINHLFASPRKTIKHGLANCLIKLDNDRNQSLGSIKSDKNKYLLARELATKVINNFAINQNFRPQDIQLNDYIQILDYLWLKQSKNKPLINNNA